MKLLLIVIYFRYNCYKLLGFDLLLDADLRVHVLEVNARPQLLDDPVDRAVNRPMVSVRGAPGLEGHSALKWVI